MKGILITNIQTEVREDANNGYTFGPVVSHRQELTVEQHPYTSSVYITSVKDDHGQPLYMTHVWTEWEPLTRWYGGS